MTLCTSPAGSLTQSKPCHRQPSGATYIPDVPTEEQLPSSLRLRFHVSARTQSRQHGAVSQASQLTRSTARRCFPSLTVDPFDIKGAHDLFQQLIDDEDLMVDAYKYAYDAAGYYSQKNCYGRMVEAIESSPASPEKQWQQIQNRYEARTDDVKLEKYIGIARKLAVHFKEFVGVQGLVLDIGCGNGKYSGGTYKSLRHEYLDDENTVVGLDPLTSSEDRFPVVTAYGENIPFQDHIFDGVTIVSMLDHVIDPKVVFDESYRVLKDGGKLFIWSSIFSESTQPYHLHSFTEEALTELVSSMFEITRSKIYGDRQKYMFIEAVPMEEKVGYSTDYWLKQTTVDEHRAFWKNCPYKEMQESQVIDIAQKHCQDVKTILDAGAGTCRMHTPVTDAGYEYSAVDISDVMLSSCDAGVDTHVAKLTELPFEDEQFDLTMCLHVIRHNNPDNYEQIVNELCRVSGKYIIILNPFVKNRCDAKQLLYVSKDLPAHLAIFKKDVWDMPMLVEDLDAMMGENGFHRTFIESVPIDYKKKDSFVVYGKHNV
jgi:ubiquinone/menaquinone biosynthesis C-methylase UbiE